MIPAYPHDPAFAFINDLRLYLSSHEGISGQHPWKQPHQPEYAQFLPDWTMGRRIVAESQHANRLQIQGPIQSDDSDHLAAGGEAVVESPHGLKNVPVLLPAPRAPRLMARDL